MNKMDLIFDKISFPSNNCFMKSWGKRYGNPIPSHTKSTRWRSTLSESIWAYFIQVFWTSLRNCMIDFFVRLQWHVNNQLKHYSLNFTTYSTSTKIEKWLHILGESCWRCCLLDESFVEHQNRSVESSFAAW